MRPSNDTILALLAQANDWVQLREIGGSDSSRHFYVMEWALGKGYAERRQVSSRRYQYKITPAGVRYLQHESHRGRATGPIRDLRPRLRVQPREGRG